ncbi:glycoside hydrolase family 19 protein [Gaetbulibacter sp. PBL-D1]|uniref:glycoside hydrolase family 19 protein n=1 Tax=Gaetbulibacter sp. PBL-D1 TaxID=3422594 RepID=UPI003D2F1B1E
MNLHKKYKTLLKQNGITTPLRLAHFFAQIHHESNLKPVEENLNYSSTALLRVFKKYFTYSQSLEYARKPEAIANRVYANRMGNGNEMSGDGWKYRGRGFIQLTGKNNYKAITKDTGIDYLNNPELLLKEADAMISALWYWNNHNLNHYADRDDLMTITKRINGGYNGLAHRRELLEYYKSIFIV